MFRDFEIGSSQFLLERGANPNPNPNPNPVSRYYHRAAHAVARLTGRTEIAALLEQFGKS
jgi:hypothetical protein